MHRFSDLATVFVKQVLTPANSPSPCLYIHTNMFMYTYVEAYKHDTYTLDGIHVCSHIYVSCILEVVAWWLQQLPCTTLDMLYIVDRHSVTISIYSDR